MTYTADSNSDQLRREYQVEDVKQEFIVMFSAETHPRGNQALKTIAGKISCMTG
jgi:hypothetical protein